MTENHKRPGMLAAAGIAAIAIAAGGGYWAGARRSEGAVAQGLPELSVAAQAASRAPLYYQDPEGKPDYSATPKKTAGGRDFIPVYEDKPAAALSPPPASQTSAQGKGGILYYRNPMGLADTSPVPKKDAMGMAYIPVYENEAPSDSGIVQVSPGRLQMLGVKTAPVETRASFDTTIRATGIVQPDEIGLSVVTTKFDCVVEKLFVPTTGTLVHAGQPLARVWIQIPDKMMQAGPDLLTREVDYLFALKHNDLQMAAESARNLREYGIPESAIAEMTRTGQASRSVTIVAPRDGVVLDKPVIEGTHITTGDPLFKIADLSTVWLIAEVQEQDLGAMRPGLPVNFSLVAYPGRTFSGKVDFIYPTVDPATRTGRVRIVVPNPDGALRVSMYATVAIDARAASAGKVLVVPDSAVIDSGTQQIVLIDRGQGHFEPRRVHVGERGNGDAQILDGVKQGESVVTSANFLIDAESDLRAALSSFADAQSTTATKTVPSGQQR